VRGFLKENKDVFARVDSELRKKLGIGASAVPAEVPAVPVNGAVVAHEAVKARK
jgi:recombination protein RecA